MRSRSVYSIQPPAIYRDETLAVNAQQRVAQFMAEMWMEGAAEPAVLG